MPAPDPDPGGASGEPLSEPAAARRSRVLLWTPVVLLVVLQTTLSSRPVGVDLPGFPGADKLVHLSYFALTAFLAMRACRRGTRLSLRAARIAVFFGGVAYGLFDELHQSLVPGRTPDPLDLLADAAGTLIAVRLGPTLLERWERRMAGGQGLEPR